jgi:hypothetical protein
MLAELVGLKYMQIGIVDDIVEVIYNDKLAISLDIAKQCVKERIEFSKGKSYPMLVDARGIKTIDKAARDYLAVEGIEFVTAGAFIIGSAVTRILGNIFLMINKPKIPTRLFTNEVEALAWLSQYKNSSSF